MFIFVINSVLALDFLLKKIIFKFEKMHCMKCQFMEGGLGEGCLACSPAPLSLVTLLSVKGAKILLIIVYKTLVQ